MMKPLLFIIGILFAAPAFSQCPPTTPTITGTSLLCNGASGSLSVTSSGNTYTWSPGGATTSSINISPTVTTTYSVIAGQTGCTVTANANITVTVASTPTVIASTSNPTVCASQNFTLSAAGAATYSWSTGASTSTTVISPPFTTNPAVINKSYTVTGTNACGSSTSAISVLVNSFPTLNSSPANPSLCKGSQITLTASGSAPNYTWTLSGSTVPVASTATVVVSPTITTSYDLVSTYGGSLCYTFMSVTVTVNACTGIEQLQGEPYINVYPNPVNEIMYVNIPGINIGEFKLEVYDAVGKLVLTEPLAESVNSIATSVLPAGLYIYKISEKKSILKTGKLIKH